MTMINTYVCYLTRFSTITTVPNDNKPRKLQYLTYRITVERPIDKNLVPVYPAECKSQRAQTKADDAK